MENLFKKFNLYKFLVFSIINLIVLILGFNFYLSSQEKAYQQKQKEVDLETRLLTVSQELKNLKSQNQYIINQKLTEEIKNIETTYQQAVDSYEKLLDLKSEVKDTRELDKLFAQSLAFLSQRNFASAASVLTTLNTQIVYAKKKLIASIKIPENLPVESKPPDSGYRRQVVKIEAGSFLVDIISADLNSTRVIVDTASESDCHNDCPVLPLADYVNRNGAFAGINGSYFCPAEYPSCAGKTNSFDTLLMNKNKVYFNSDNNIYSTVPAVIFSGNSARFVRQSLEWGRDTSSVDAVIANHPLLVLNNQVVFGGNDDPKQGSKGNRSFIGASGSTVYIGVVHNATVAESALVLHSLGIKDALNLDDGGSTALWSGGYIVGPGRNLPNAVLLVRK